MELILLKSKSSNRSPKNSGGKTRGGASRNHSGSFVYLSSLKCEAQSRTRGGAWALRLVNDLLTRDKTLARLRRHCENFASYDHLSLNITQHRDLLLCSQCGEAHRFLPDFLRLLQLLALKHLTRPKRNLQLQRDIIDGMVLQDLPHCSCCVELLNAPR